MKVEDYDRNSFLVHSESTSDIYLVDLEEEWPYGQCSCKNWECERWPLIKSGVPPKNEDDYRCKHLRACRKLLAKRLKL